MEVVQSSIESVVKREDRSGYTVIRFKLNGELYNLVGFLGTMPRAGERFYAEGHWVDNARYGHQFFAAKLQSIAPASEEELIIFLSSGLFPGIGKGTAKKMVDLYGDSILEVIDQRPKLLLSVTGIGRNRLDEIVAAWHEHHGLRDVAKFLAPHGFSLSLAGKVWKEWAGESLKLIQADPYQLYHKFSGASFHLVDRLATGQMGLPKDSTDRIRAGITEAMSESYGDGHACLPREILLKRASTLLNQVGPRFAEVLTDMVKLSEMFEETLDGKELVYSPGLRRAEIDIAQGLQTFAAYRPILAAYADFNVISELSHNARLPISASQRSALQTIFKNPVSVLTGGPGTGKTRITELVVKAAQAADVPIHLGAPTGRAAKRLSESTRVSAYTLHRLLAYNPAFEKFQRNRESPLPAGLVLVDEVSMLDLPIAASLIRAVEAGSQVVLVGDVDQLPAVGPGNVLKNIIEARPECIARLTEIHRQSKGSQIVSNAHRLLAGEGMDFPDSSEIDDLCFLQALTPEAVLRKLEKCIERLRDRGFNPRDQIQVLVPTKKGALGARAVNRFIQDWLNPLEENMPTAHGLRPNDKVVQVSNDYEREVFNGNIGYVERIDPDMKTAWIIFDGRPHEYAFSELDSVELAYAMTVHKSQGSEYPAVITLIHPQHGPVLSRRLLYTAITRARKFLVMIGDPESVHAAAQNVSETYRHTGLLQRLKQQTVPAAVLEPAQRGLSFSKIPADYFG